MVNNDNCAENMNFYFVSSLPANPAPHSIYFVKNGETITTYVISLAGVPYLIGGSGGGAIALTSPDGSIYIDGYEIQVSQSLINQIISVHNSLSGLQGGTTGEYYHLTQSQYNQLQSLLYVNNTAILTLSPATGEKAVSTPITLFYNINTGSDIFTSASINQGVGSVLANVNTGTLNVSGGSKLDTATYVLSYTYIRNGQTLSEAKTATYTARTPQWEGISASNTLDSANYATLNSSLTKLIQAQPDGGLTPALNMSIDVAPTNQYIYFLTTKSNAAITNNGFNVDIQPWGDTVTGGFWKKSITVTLADGTTTATIWIYRTRTTRTHSSQNYTLK